MKTKTFLALLFPSFAGRYRKTKKILTGVVLCSVLVSSWSCVVYSWKQKPLESVRPGKREGLKICAVQNKTGERIEFSKEFPARIKGDSVFEEKLVKIAIEKSDIDHPHYFHVLTPPFDLTTKDGHLYRVTQLTELENKIVGLAYAPFPAMPLSDIDLVTIRGVNLASTLLLSLGVPAALFFILMGIAMNGWL
jgi:hypothetical protein